MIHALSIQDFVLIRTLCLEAGHGFTALTGETGAGKSILLEALGLALGGRADKRFVRAGAERASVTVEFAPAPEHVVWSRLETAGIVADPGDVLMFRRLLPASGSARGYINDQPVSAPLMAAIGEALVERHGQHAASGLFNPGAHRNLLDQYAGNTVLLMACETAWSELQVARTARAAHEADQMKISAELAWLCEAVADLTDLAPEDDEVVKLTEERRVLGEMDRIRANVSEAAERLEVGDPQAVLGRIISVLERLVTGSALSGESEVGQHMRGVCAGFERAMIELDEAVHGLGGLTAYIVSDRARLETVDERLFRLKSAARKYGVPVEDLSKLLETLTQKQTLCEAESTGFSDLVEREAHAAANWHGACDRLTKARKIAAHRLEKAVRAELIPLKLERMRLRVDVDTLDAEKNGAFGSDRVEIMIETNPGHGFAPLRKIASGGELARVALALKCALAGAGSAPTLIFDEADQGVGGAVAAAIGRRLCQLSQDRQVLAITHSPQVAASAAAQWRIEKSRGRKGVGQTEVRVLDGAMRREEIARMLSGAVITQEARAAAGQLLEGA